MKNTLYFLKETLTILKIGFLSNLLSLLSIGFVFFILALMLSTWNISVYITQNIENEAEISVFYQDDHDTSILINDIKDIEGVTSTRYVTQEEAYSHMEEILGNEANILSHFDRNPFSAYIEVGIQIDYTQQVLEALNDIEGVDHIRDNREVLDQISRLSRLIRLLGFLMIIAVGVSTFIIVSHIIRQGVYNNKDQIQTLRLLGASEGFISVPFFITGFLLTLGGIIISLLLTYFSVQYIYQNFSDVLPFIPLPDLKDLISNVAVFVMGTGMFLAVIGSVFGLNSSKRNG